MRESNTSTRITSKFSHSNFFACKTYIVKPIINFVMEFNRDDKIKRKYTYFEEEYCKTKLCLMFIPL
jgi:hypothetical protein